MAGVGAEAAVDLPGELLGGFVKDGGDITKAGNAHDDALGGDVGDGREVDGDHGQASIYDSAGLGLHGDDGFLCRRAGIADLGRCGIAKLGSEFKDAVVGAEDDVAGKGVVFTAAFDFSGKYSEHEFVAILRAGIEHFIGMEAAGIAVGVDGLFEVFFEECF